MSLLSFTPGVTVGQAITATAGTITVGGLGLVLRIANTGSGQAYVAFFTPPASPPTVSATTAIAIPPGSVQQFCVGSDLTQVAVIGDATGTTLNVCRGEGSGR